MQFLILFIFGRNREMHRFHMMGFPESIFPRLVRRKKHAIRIIIKIYFVCFRKQIDITMGGDVSAEEKIAFEQKLHFHQELDDEQLGLIDIYRFKEPPYEYLMNHQKNFIDGDLRPWEKYFAHMIKLKAIEHKNLAKIHLVDSKKQTHLCLKGTRINTFCTYYNFTLRQAIEKKKLKETRFTESQLVYMFWCLLDLAQELQKCGISVGEYRAERIYLSPQGYIKMYLLEIESDNRHRAYYKALTEKSRIDELVLAPEELAAIYQLISQPKFDIFKSDLFSIALVILQLMTLENIKFYYNDQRNGFKMGRIAFDLNSFSSQYSYQFLDLLRNCLEENTNYRITLGEAFKILEQIKKNSANVSYCVRLNEDEQNKKKKISTSVKSQYILSGIEKRLTPIPIETLSQSTSSGFQSKNSVYRNEDSSRMRKGY